MFCFVEMLNDLNFQYLLCHELMLISTFKLNVMFVIDFISWNRLNLISWSDFNDLKNIYMINFLKLCHVKIFVGMFEKENGFIFMFDFHS
jgi:hypothetical protein